MQTIDFRQLLYALADALDLVGVDDVQHGKRVAFMARECGRQLGLDAASLELLFHAALIHDCGVSSTREHRQLVGELDWQGAEAHCQRGWELVRGEGLFDGLAPLILHHHTHWERLAALAVADDVRLLSNCIYLADRVDALIAQVDLDEVLLMREAVTDTISRHRGSNFAPELVEAFLAASDNEYFWLTLEPRHLESFLADQARQERLRPMDGSQLRRVADIFATIVDAKSPFTAEHSRGVARLASHLGLLMELPSATCRELEVAGLLHDIGKLRVPDEILEKPGPLDDREWAAMKHHSFETFQILQRIDGLGPITEMAAFHHEKLSGDGYPFRLGADRLSPESRVVAVADVFQALAQTRPYRPSMPAGKILPLLESMAREQMLDPEIVTTLGHNLSSCWEAAVATAPSP